METFRGLLCVQRSPSGSQASQNSRRMSAERFEKKYRGIGVLRDATRGQLRPEAVDDARSVGVDQAAEEALGVAIHDLALPSVENDGPQVLAAWSVLREQSIQPFQPASRLTTLDPGLKRRWTRPWGT
jgi:hypothetical protein